MVALEKPSGSQSMGFPMKPQHLPGEKAEMVYFPLKGLHCQEE